MPAGVGDLSTYLQPDRSERFLVMRVEVNPEVILEMLVDRSVGPSVISEAARLWLVVSAAVPFDFENSIIPLQRLRVGNTPIPDVKARVSATLSSPDGILGREFLRHYREVRYNDENHELTLVDP